MRIQIMLILQMSKKRSSDLPQATLIVSGQMGIKLSPSHLQTSALFTPLDHFLGCN